MQDNSHYNKWLEFAKQDLASAKHLLTMHPAPIEVISAAEKALEFIKPLLTE